MAIYITGDTHGDFSRFRKNVFYAQSKLTKDDYMIICGDFGGIWDNSHSDRYQLDQLNKRSFTTLFISGNHENYDLLAAYPVQEWHGGKVQFIRPSLIHLMRGQIYEIEGKRFFTMGGASSHDIDDGILEPDDPLFKVKCKHLNSCGGIYRVNHQSWWKEELPSEAEYQTARASLERCGWTVDYIITHCGPTSLQDKLRAGFYHADALSDFLEEVAQKCQFEEWFLGHYHIDQRMQKRFVLLYEQIHHLK